MTQRWSSQYKRHRDNRVCQYGARLWEAKFRSIVETPLHEQCCRVSARQGSMRFCPTNISLKPHFISPGGPKTPLYLKSQCHYNMKGLKFGLLGPILRILWGPTIFWLKPWCWGQLRNYILCSKVSWCFTIYVMCSIYRRLTTKSLIPVLEIPIGSRLTTLEEDREHFVNFMFTIWDSRHEDLQLFWLSFKHCLTH